MCVPYNVHGLVWPNAHRAYWEGEHVMPPTTITGEGRDGKITHKPSALATRLQGMRPNFDADGERSADCL